MHIKRFSRLMGALKTCKSRRLSQSFSLLGICLAMISPAQSLYLENMNGHSLKDTRIAYYPGSFDPLHLGHVDVVKSILDKGLADFVLIYALPDSDSMKDRTPHGVRFQMLESAFKNHPKVLITNLKPGSIQEKLAPLYNRIEFSVVVGSDVVNQYVNTSQYDSIWMQGISIKDKFPQHTNTSTGAIMMIPAQKVIAFNREGDNLAYIGHTYKSRPMTLIDAPLHAGVSSTQARLMVADGQTLKDIVPEEVVTIIKTNGLYRK